MDSIIKPTHPMFPFVISHASSPARRYTLYTNSERERNKWHMAFVDALGVRKVVIDANRVRWHSYTSTQHLCPSPFSGLPWIQSMMDSSE